MGQLNTAQYIGIKRTIVRIVIVSLLPRYEKLTFLKQLLILPDSRYKAVESNAANRKIGFRLAVSIG